MTNSRYPPETVREATNISSNGTSLRVEIDWDYYVAMIDEPGLSHAEKLELVEAWWNIVLSFVHLGYHVDSVQTVLDELKVTEKANAAIPPSRPLLSGDFRQTGAERKDSAKSRKAVL